LHIVRVAVYRDGIKGQFEDSAALKATQRHGLDDFTRGFRTARYCDLAIDFYWRGDARSELVAGIAEVRPYRIGEAHGDDGAWRYGHFFFAEPARCLRRCVVV